jgi:polyhydroxyalkanoate synthase subunit PhaC
MPAAGLIDTIRRDTERSLFRAKNGLKYATGIGRPQVGLAPKQVVWRREKARMVRYDSDRRAGRRPLLIIFSIMGRSYVLDLRPGNSFVEWLLAEGNDVFLVDFGEPGAVDASNTLETYVDGYLPRAVNAAVAETGADGVDVLGYCFGGVLSVLLAAAHPELPIRNLAVMATPIDFGTTTGALQALASGSIDLDDVLDGDGNVPAEAVHRMFRTLKPTAGIANYAALWEKLWNDEFVDGFQAMSQWARDQVPFPGAAARQGLELLLRRNALLGGEIPLGGRTVRLADIDCPLLNIMAERDHIVSPAAARPLNDLVSSADVRELLVPAGHIGLATSRQAVKYTIPELNAWLMART